MTPGRLAHLKHKAGIQGALHLYHATEIIEALEAYQRRPMTWRRRLALAFERWCARQDEACPPVEW